MEMNVIFGEKSLFAIEVSPAQDPRFGYMRLWLNDTYLGAYEDFQCISGTIAQLKNLTYCQINHADCTRQKRNDLFDYLKKAQRSQHLNIKESLGEAFDDFTLFAWQNNGEILFVWRLEPSPYFDYGNYDHEVKSACIPQAVFEAVLADFDHYFEIRQST